MSDQAIITVRITPAAVKAKRAYFSALWALWRTCDLYGYEPTGIFKDIQEVAKERLRQAHRALGRAIGGVSRRRGRDGKTVPSISGLRIASGILEFERKRKFVKKFGEDRRAWAPPTDWSKMPPEWQSIHAQIEAINAQLAQVGSWGCEHGSPVAP